MRFRQWGSAGFIVAAAMAAAAAGGYYVINPASCNGCAACVDVCVDGAIYEVPGGSRSKYAIDPQKCTDCGKCLDACNRGAVSRVEIPSSLNGNTRDPQKVSLAVRQDSRSLFVRSEAPTTGNVTLCSIAGKKVIQVVPGTFETSMHLGSLAPGVYTLTVPTQQGILSKSITVQ